ncbi:hypothetical protein Pd630_LPD16121 (plasmid) [Rhodococcus opacus PD630]|nr:hypothetical protein Pd630_LPD16121 [Rhodococcus opacus PD630]
MTRSACHECDSAVELTGSTEFGSVLDEAHPATIDSNGVRDRT